MQNIKSMAATAVVIAAAIAASATAHAQNRPIAPWQPPKELDPAKRVTPTARPADTKSEVVDGRDTGPVRGTPAAQAGQAATYAPLQRHSDAADRGGFFVGIKGGKGWVYDDVDQSARELNLGYRWQAGPVALVGIELAGGKLEDTVDDGRFFDEVDYASIGANARFNFGSSPVFALVRAGYMTADSDWYGSVDGGYLGVGLGVDITRHVNLGLVYTNYVYFNELYWDGDQLNYDADRADTVMFGIEARF